MEEGVALTTLPLGCQEVEEEEARMEVHQTSMTRLDGNIEALPWVMICGDLPVVLLEEARHRTVIDSHLQIDTIAGDLGISMIAEEGGDLEVHPSIHHSGGEAAEEDEHVAALHHHHRVEGQGQITMEPLHFDPTRKNEIGRKSAGGND